MCIKTRFIYESLRLSCNCIKSYFYHSFAYGEKEEELWDLAADAAVENVVLEMGLPMGGLDTDAEAGINCII